MLPTVFQWIVFECLLLIRSWVPTKLKINAHFSFHFTPTIQPICTHACPSSFSTSNYTCTKTEPCKTLIENIHFPSLPLHPSLCQQITRPKTYGDGRLHPILLKQASEANFWRHTLGKVWDEAFIASNIF